MINVKVLSEGVHAEVEGSGPERERIAFRRTVTGMVALATMCLPSGIQTFMSDPIQNHLVLNYEPRRPSRWQLFVEEQLGFLIVVLILGFAALCTNWLFQGVWESHIRF